MTKDVLLEKLKDIVKPYVKDEAGFKNMTEGSDFLNDLKINSANLVDVILDIENEFDIIIDNDSMEKMLNVKSAIDIITDKLGAK
jgi:acyl carrier protein